MACNCIHRLVDPRQREIVFGTSLVEVGEVDANSSLATILYQDRVGEPLWVMSFSNEVSSEQPVSFLVEGLTPLRIHLPRFLLL